MILFGWLLLVGGAVGLLHAIQARGNNFFWLGVVVRDQAEPVEEQGGGEEGPDHVLAAARPVGQHQSRSS